MTLRVMIVIIIIFVVAIGIPKISIMQDDRVRRYALVAVFGTYLLAEIYFTLLSREPLPDIHYNLIPFSTIAMFSDKKEQEEILLNVLLFIPMGYLLPLVSKNKFGGFFVVCIGFTVSLITEIIQLIFRLGWFEVDDIILNILGTLIGFTVYWYWLKDRCR